MLLGMAAFGLACGSTDSVESGQSATILEAETTVSGEDQPGASNTTSESTEPTETTATTQTSTDPIDGCRRLTDFDGDVSNWFVVNDGVMGGRSNGALAFTDSTMQFTGTVVTDGGGFTSVRTSLGGELTGSTRLDLRVRTDARSYAVTLQDATLAGSRPVAHEAVLATDGSVDADGWLTVSLAYGELRPTIFGQPIDADAFDPDQASQFGVIIADGVDGEFAFEVDWIDACN